MKRRYPPSRAQIAAAFRFYGGEPPGDDKQKAAEVGTRAAEAKSELKDAAKFTLATCPRQRGRR